MAAAMSVKDWQLVTALLEKIAAEPGRQRLASQADTIVEWLDKKTSVHMTAAACSQVTKDQVGWCMEVRKC